MKTEQQMLQMEYDALLIKKRRAELELEEINAQLKEVGRKMLIASHAPLYEEIVKI